MSTADGGLDMGALLRPGKSLTKAGASPEHVKEGLELECGADDLELGGRYYSGSTRDGRCGRQPWAAASPGSCWRTACVSGADAWVGGDGLTASVLS